MSRFDDARHIISYRETIFGILSKSPHIRESLHIGIKDSRAVEVKAVVKQSEFARKNDLIQQSLTAATYLSELVPACADVGVKIDVVAQFEAASILWMQGEISSSVQMLQSLRQRKDLDEQTVTIGSAGLLAQLVCELFRHYNGCCMLTRYRVMRLLQLDSRIPKSSFLRTSSQQLHNSVRPSKVPKPVESSTSLLRSAINNSKTQTTSRTFSAWND